MKMLTKEGKIVEGQPLSEEDIAVLGDLSIRLNDSGVYLPYGAASKLASFLVTNYEMRNRAFAIEVVDEHPVLAKNSEEVD